MSICLNVLIVLELIKDARDLLPASSTDPSLSRCLNKIRINKRNKGSGASLYCGSSYSSFKINSKQLRTIK